MVPELAVTGMVAVGLALAFQAPVNGALGRFTGPLPAVLVSFTVGLLILAFISLATGGAGRLDALGGVSPALLTGGLFGALYVAVATWSVTRVGAGAVAAATIAGQMTSSLLVDHLDAFGVEGQVIGAGRALGAVLLVSGTILVASRAGTPILSGRGERTLLITGAVFVAGLLVGIQHPLNSDLAENIGGLQAGLVNFGVGTLAMALVVVLIGNARKVLRVRKAPLWCLAGGPVGVVVVMASLGAVPVIGAAAIAAATVTGQLVGSTMLDRAGLLGLEPRPVDRERAAGLLLLVVGTLLVV